MSSEKSHNSCLSTIGLTDAFHAVSWQNSRTSFAAADVRVHPPWNGSHKNNFQTERLASCVTFKKGWLHYPHVRIGLPLRSQTISIFYWVAGNLLLGCLQTPFYNMLCCLLEMRITSFVVFTEVRTKCLRLTTAQFLNHLGLCSRDREIPANQLTAERTGYPLGSIYKTFIKSIIARNMSNVEEQNKFNKESYLNYPI
jgi:hypothetical protein